MKSVPLVVFLLVTCCLASLAIADDATETPKSSEQDTMLKIKYVTVIVDDQDKALQFYTEKLGFVKKSDIPIGEYRWLTVVSPDDPDGAELALEPNANPASKTFQDAIYAQGIPFTALEVDDVEKAYEKLKERGVEFRSGPQNVGTAVVAVFEDTCGNLIMITQASE